MRDHVVLYVNGQRRELRGFTVFKSLSTYLREDLGLTGTKVVCSEGDCGSCTVLLGETHGLAIRYRAICSCIKFVFQADGCHVVTVEGLGSDGRLNPIQEALVEHHGTQCGFCTPGVVMSIQALLESDPVLSERRLREGLVGNLCRCTGYDPIVRAALKVDTRRVDTMSRLFNSSELSQALALSRAEPVRIESHGRTFFKPVTIEDAFHFKATHPDCMIVSGGTDLGVQVNKGKRELKTVLSTAALSEFRGLRISDVEIIAGANVSITELSNALATAIPEYAALLARFGSPQIKNAATLGGNIANASPIGDTMPALFVLNAQVELCGPRGFRRVNINDFYCGYKRTVSEADEFISRVYIPLLAGGEVLKLFKVSKRADLDISTFSAAFWLKLSGAMIEDIRIAYGGVAPMIVRLPKTEARLKGAPISAESFESAGETVLSEVSPISDVRGSSEYRNLLATNILRKLYYDLEAMHMQVSAS